MNFSLSLDLLLGVALATLFLQFLNGLFFRGVYKFLEYKSHPLFQIMLVITPITLVLVGNEVFLYIGMGDLGSMDLAVAAFMATAAIFIFIKKNDNDKIEG